MNKGWRAYLINTAAIVGAVALIAILIVPGGREMVRYVGGVFVYGISNVSDVNECSKIRDAFLLRHDIPKNAKSMPGQPPVFCNPRSTGLVIKTPPTFVVYGVINKDLQDQYIASLKIVRREVGSDTIQVEFYEQENWIEWKSQGASGAQRGPERLLRREVISY